MMYSYLIYQRPIDSELKDIINENRNRPLATAYFDTMSMLIDEDGPEDIVNRAWMYKLYQPTMFMNFTVNFGKSNEVKRLEEIFDEGNNYGSGIITTTHLMQHPVMAVGDLAINLLDDRVFVCMPNGWHQMVEASLDVNVY